MAQKCEKCGSDRMWVMRRQIEPQQWVTVMRDGKEFQVVATEIYGAECEKCGNKTIFPDPVPETEIEWKPTKAYAE